MKYSPDIEPRPLRFPPPPVLPKLWHGGKDIETYHFNALAIFLPLLEKLVVLSLKKSLKENLPPKLKAEVASLIAQEAIHGSEFYRWNTSIVSRHYPIYTKHYKLRSFRIFAGLMNRFSTTFHYALSAAGEHFTAIAADLFLRSPKWFKGVDPIYSAIWRWHCIEEIEHKTVAFDVLKARNGSYGMRIFGMLLMTLVFALLYLKPLWIMMKHDKKHKGWSFFVRLFQYYLGKGGLCRVLLKPYLDYYKPSFHPSQQENDHLIEEWKKFFQHASFHEIKTALQFETPPHTTPKIHLL